MSDSLERYQRHLEAVPKLTSEWFEPMLKEYRSNSEAAKSALLLASLPLVVDFVLSRRRHYVLPDLDLVQEGNVGLPAALKTFTGLDGFAYTAHVTKCLEERLAAFLAAR